MSYIFEKYKVNLNDVIFMGYTELKASSRAEAESTLYDQLSNIENLKLVCLGEKV